MENINLEKFEHCWENFLTRVRGELMITAKTQKLSAAVAKFTLSAETDFWESEIQEGGRWLANYEKENPEKAAVIRDILLKDMTFTDEDTPKNGAEALKVALPIGAAAAGLTVSRLSGANNVVQVAATVIPAAASVPLAKSMAGNLKSDAQKKLIQAYLDQLDKYHKGVESCLKEP